MSVIPEAERMVKMSDRLFPMQDDDHHRKSGTHAPPLPWPVAEAIWEHLYKADGHGSQSLEEITERCGFAYSEIEWLANHLQKRRERKSKGRCP